MSKHHISKVCSVIACYYPDDSFESRARELAQLVGTLIIFDNSEGQVLSPEFLTFIESSNVHYYRAGVNLGLGTALNYGLRYAKENNYTYMLTLDQDSIFDPDLVQHLLSLYEVVPNNVGIIGANFINPHNNKVKYKVDKDYKYTQVKTVQTSGNLIDVEIVDSVGGFREEFFIDQIDHDICLRLNKNQQYVLVSSKVLMTHFAGDDRDDVSPIVKMFPRHNAVRRYYIVRNSIVLIREYFFTSFSWSIKRLVKLLLGIPYSILFGGDFRNTIKLSVLGIAHGLSGRLGVLDGFDKC